MSLFRRKCCALPSPGTWLTSFNMISIDGDTSTNDMVTVMANSMAGNAMITAPGDDFDVFCKALATITRSLSRMIAADGEGATKLLVCRVSRALDCENARRIAKSVICSNLVKATNVWCRCKLGTRFVRYWLQRREGWMYLRFLSPSPLLPVH